MTIKYAFGDIEVLFKCPYWCITKGGSLLLTEDHKSRFEGIIYFSPTITTTLILKVEVKAEFFGKERLFKKTQIQKKCF